MTEHTEVAPMREIAISVTSELAEAFVGKQYDISAVCGHALRDFLWQVEHERLRLVCRKRRMKQIDLAMRPLDDHSKKRVRLTVDSLGKVATRSDPIGLKMAQLRASDERIST